MDHCCSSGRVGEGALHRDGRLLARQAPAREGALVRFWPREGALVRFWPREGALVRFWPREGALVRFWPREGALVRFWPREGALVRFWPRSWVAARRALSPPATGHSCAGHWRRPRRAARRGARRRRNRPVRAR